MLTQRVAGSRPRHRRTRHPVRAPSGELLSHRRRHRRAGSAEQPGRPR